MKNNRETENTINRFKREIALARTMWFGGLLGVIGAVVSIFAPVAGIPLVLIGGLVLAGTVVASLIINKPKYNNSESEVVFEVTDYEDITNKENTNNKQTILEKETIKTNNNETQNNNEIIR